MTAEHLSRFNESCQLGASFSEPAVVRNGSTDFEAEAKSGGGGASPFVKAVKGRQGVEGAVAFDSPKYGRYGGSQSRREAVPVKSDPFQDSQAQTGQPRNSSVMAGDYAAASSSSGKGRSAG